MHYCCTVFKIVGLASQFVTQNCLVCYSKWNLGCKFHADVATYFPHIKLKILFNLHITIIATQLLLIATQAIQDLSSNLHAKIATQLYKIISDTVVSTNDCMI